MKKLFSVLAGILLIAGCSGDNEQSSRSPASESGATKVRLVLNWFPEAEHGGFYAANVHGIYAAEGLEVEIIPGGVDVPVVQRVAGGQMQFGILNADDLIFGRLAEADIVALMAPMQRSPRVIVVHEESGFESLADLNNITISMNAANPFAQFMQAKFPMENVRVVPFGGSVAPFVANKNFAVQGYNISEPFVARQAGANPRVLFLADEGFNPYTSLLVTSNSYLDRSTETVRKMVRASIVGWAKYMADPEETNRYIHSLNPEMGEDILAFGVAEMQDMVEVGDAADGKIGAMTQERWADLIATLEEIKAIDAGLIRPEDCYTTEFLP